MDDSFSDDDGDSSTENRVYLFRELAAAYIAAKPDAFGDDGKSALAEIARISCMPMATSRALRSWPSKFGRARRQTRACSV